MGFGLPFLNFVFETGVRLMSKGVKIGFYVQCVLLDLDLCFSEVLDMDLGTICLVRDHVKN